MLQVEFYETIRTGQKLPGSLTLEKGKLKVRCLPDSKTLFANLLEDAKEETDLAAWMRGLPEMYSGAYLRAKLIEEPESTKFKDTMRTEYDMSGAVRGKFTSRPKVDEQAVNEIFSKAGFDRSLRDSFNRICAFIASADGCNAGIYKPPHMNQMRAAHVLPGEGGRKKANQVFLIVEPRIHGMVLKRRRRFGKGRYDPDCRKEVGANYSDWARLEASLKEWSYDVKRPTKPKTALEWGDGHALPGGLPETNRSKF